MIDIDTSGKHNSWAILLQLQFVFVAIILQHVYCFMQDIWNATENIYFDYLWLWLTVFIYLYNCHFYKFLSGEGIWDEAHIIYI